MSAAHDYLEAILWRGRRRMEPVDFEPDWSDKPRKSKFYPGIDPVELPRDGFDDRPTVADGLFAPAGTEPFTVPLLAGMLRHSYSLLGRRLAMHANGDVNGLHAYANANWHRGTASGGGLYPVSIYWASGPSGPGLPGLHYYSNPHHAMQRLATGDFTDEVRAAIGDLPDAASTDQFLVLGVKFWQNAFKYNSFSYHAVTMDVGTIIQTWRMWAGAHGLRVWPALWFDDRRLGRLIDELPSAEGIFAVLPLQWDTPPGPATAPAIRSHPSPLSVRDQEISRRVMTFETVTTLHAATMQTTSERPAASALAGAAALPVQTGSDIVTLPAPLPLNTPIGAALRSRRSSFGRLSGTHPTTAAQLRTVLAAAEAAAHFDCDVAAPDGLALVRFYVFVTHVAAIPAGVYAFDPALGALHLLKPGARGEFLQRNYFLENYNLEQAGAVVVPTIRTSAVLDAVGDRGYRLSNAVIGAVSQAFYIAAGAVGLGCGVALGFDNVSYVEELDLAERGEAPFLIMLLGNERTLPADVRYDIG